MSPSSHFHLPSLEVLLCAFGVTQVLQPSTAVELGVDGLDLIFSSRPNTSAFAFSDWPRNSNGDTLHLIRLLMRSPPDYDRIARVPGVEYVKRDMWLCALACQKGFFGVECKTAQLRSCTISGQHIRRWTWICSIQRTGWLGMGLLLISVLMLSA